jgi:hypothetical protein
MKIRRHARSQRIAIGQPMPIRVTSAAIASTPNTRRIERRETEERKRMLNTVERKICASMGLDPAAYERHRSAHARQTAGASDVSVDAAIMRNLGLEKDAKEDQFLGDLDSVCRAALKSDEPETRASAARVLMALAESLP